MVTRVEVLQEVRKQAEHIAAILQLAHGRGLTDREVAEERLSVRPVGGLSVTYPRRNYDIGQVPGVIVFPWVARGFRLTHGGGGVNPYVVFGRSPPTAEQVANPWENPNGYLLPRAVPGVEFSAPRHFRGGERVGAYPGERVSAMWFPTPISSVQLIIW